MLEEVEVGVQRWSGERAGRSGVTQSLEEAVEEGARNTRTAAVAVAAVAAAARHGERSSSAAWRP